MIGLTVVLYWLLTDESFRITEASVDFEGLEHADEAAVRAHLSGIDRSPNVFRVRASDIVSDVSVLPDVDAATARVTLPAIISVTLSEREPLFVWSGGEVAWMVDVEGMLFGPTGFTQEAGEPSATDEETGEPGADDVRSNASPDTSAAPAPAPVSVDIEAIDLPLVVDARFQVEQPTVGSHLAQADLVVMRQLLAVTPELLGGRSTDLRLRVDNKLGYVLHSDRGWSAVFGHYTPRVQPPDTIPRQVQCLRALLAVEERKLERVRLAISEDGCGTYTQRK